MDAMEAIKTRRSIRKYLNKSIPNKTAYELIEMGMNAPSAGNEKPWHFVIIDKYEIFKKIPNFHPHSDMLKEAAIAILVCFDINLEKHPGMAVQDCSAATENILIAANAKLVGNISNIRTNRRNEKNIKYSRKYYTSFINFNRIS